MSSLHLFQCVCHGYTFWGNVQEDSQSIDNLQAGTGIVNIEHVYESGDRQVSVGFSNVPYSPQVFGTPDGIPTSHSTRAPGPLPPLGCGCGLCGGLEVPQRPYIPVQMSPDLSQRNGEIFTFSKGGCGIRLVDAVQNRLSGLVGGDDLVFVSAPVSTFSLRIEWPGYRLWTGKFRAKNWGGTNGPVTRARLVSQLGKRIAEFIEDMEDVECADLAWKVGSRSIIVDHLVLVSLTHVSRGSWQPLLRLLP